MKDSRPDRDDDYDAIGIIQASIKGELQDFPYCDQDRDGNTYTLLTEDSGIRSNLWVYSKVRSC